MRVMLLGVGLLVGCATTGYDEDLQRRHNMTRVQTAMCFNSPLCQMDAQNERRHIENVQMARDREADRRADAVRLAEIGPTPTVPMTSIASQPQTPTSFASYLVYRAAAVCHSNQVPIFLRALIPPHDPVVREGGTIIAYAVETGVSCAGLDTPNDIVMQGVRNVADEHIEHARNICHAHGYATVSTMGAKDLGGPDQHLESGVVVFRSVVLVTCN
jgi:hypothetical protein